MPNRKTLYLEREWTQPSTRKIYAQSLEVILILDPGYGADADGNRGTDVWFIDDIIELGNWDDISPCTFTAEDERAWEKVESTDSFIESSMEKQEPSNEPEYM